jgi:RHS repeat-associated protein
MKFRCFAACMDQNIKDTTFGTVDPKALTNKARYDFNRLGRFSSPDPLGGSIFDPQSLEGYDYVENDPADLTDPSGLCPSWGPFAVNGKVICTSADTHTHVPDLFGSGSFLDFSFCPPEADCINGTAPARCGRCCGGPLRGSDFGSS